MTGGGRTVSCSCWFCQGSTLKVASDGQQRLEELQDVPPQVPSGAQEVPPEPKEVPLELSEPEGVFKNLRMLLQTLSRFLLELKRFL